MASLNTLAAIYVSKQNLTEAEPLFRLSLTILDKKGILTGKRPLSLSSTDDNLDLLAQTALDYADLLKKMRRKSDASKIEARIRAVTGKSHRGQKEGRLNHLALRTKVSSGRILRSVKKLALDIGPEFLQHLRRGVDPNLRSELFHIVGDIAVIGIVRV